MTDIRRSAVSDQDTNKIVKYQVEERKDDKLRRHAVIGIGGGSEITVTELNVTENGTYTAPAGSAYSPVNVEVPAPAPNLEDITITENGTYQAGEGYDGLGTVTVDIDLSKPDYVNLVDFDFKQNNLHDNIRNFDIPNTNYSNISTSNAGITFGATNSNCIIGFIPETNSYYECKVKFGTNAEPDSSLGSYNALLKLNKSDNHQTLTYCRDVTIDDNPTGTWRLNDESGRVEYLSVGYGDSHYFDNKELIIEYGYYYNNGVFTSNANKFSYRIGDTYIYIGVAAFSIGSSGNPQIVLGGGGAVMKGTVIESLKIKQLFKWEV